MKRSSSEMGPAVIPSGGSRVRSRYSAKSRLVAVVDAILEGGGGRPEGRVLRGWGLGRCCFWGMGTSSCSCFFSRWC